MLGPLRSVSLRLILDTGSAFTLIRPSRLQHAGYDLDSPRTWIPIATASRVERIPLYIVASVTALGHTSRNVAVLAHALSRAARADGSLGMNFFGNRRLTIDFGGGATTTLE